MHLLPPIKLTRISARLLAAGPPSADPASRRHFRLLIVGPAVLSRSSAGTWWVATHADGSVLPAVGGLRPSQVARQPAVRVAAALLDPADLAVAGPALLTTLRAGGSAAARPEFYGWSLLYRLPGDGDTARVDPHDEFADLPAFYESPLEVADRQEFLAQRGIPSRALALLTSRADFDTPAGGLPRNRYCLHARWRGAGAAIAFGP